MYKCIYCNSTDLTVSDIISCALTGKKLTRKFVCRKHNAFTNDEFENTAIASLAFFRNELGLTERKGNPVKYDATVVADGMTIKQKISDRASFYQKIVSPAEKNGNHYLFGNVELLKKEAASNKSEIKIVDVTSAQVQVSISFSETFFSREMFLTVAKIAYEWYCYANDINNYNAEKFKDIVDVILLKQPVEKCVEIVVSQTFEKRLDGYRPLGSHVLYDYTDIDGYQYVVYEFWGVVTYKIRICRAREIFNAYDEPQLLMVYSINGEEFPLFSFTSTTHLPSFPFSSLTNHYFRFFYSRINELLNTKDITLPMLRKLRNALYPDFIQYKNHTCDFAQLVDYEELNRVFILYFIKNLAENEAMYDFGQSFNANMTKIFECDTGMLFFTEKSKIEFLKYLKNLHDKDALVNLVEKWIVFFDAVSANYS